MRAHQFHLHDIIVVITAADDRIAQLRIQCVFEFFAQKIIVARLFAGHRVTFLGAITAVAIMHENLIAVGVIAIVIVIAIGNYIIKFIRLVADTGCTSCIWFLFEATYFAMIAVNVMLCIIIDIISIAILFGVTVAAAVRATATVAIAAARIRIRVAEFPIVVIDAIGFDMAIPCIIQIAWASLHRCQSLVLLVRWLLCHCRRRRRRNYLTVFGD